jgi:predicted MFS family arabinose efflux permease
MANTAGEGEATMTAIGIVSREVPATASRWVTPSLALGCFVNMVGTLAISPFLPLIGDELDVSVAVLGQIPTLTMLLAAALGILAGPLGDRYGHRRSLVIALGTSTISALGIAWAPGLAPLFVAGLFGAVGRAVVMPTAQAIMGSAIHDETLRRQAISWVATGTTAAPLIGIPLLTTVAAVTQWRVSFAIVGLLSLVMSVALWRLLPADTTATRGAFRLRDILCAYAPLLRHRPSIALIGASLVVNIGTWATFTYMAAFFVQMHAFTTSEVGGTYLVCGIGTVLGTRVVGSRLGARCLTLLVTGRILGGICVLGALSLPVPPLVALTLLALAALASTMGMASTTVMLASDAPGGRGTSMTLHASALSLGTAVGAAVGGLILTVASYQTVGIVSMALFVASASVVWRWYTHSHPDAAQESAASDALTRPRAV